MTTKMTPRFGSCFCIALAAILALGAADRACAQAVPTGQFAAIYRGTATYTVTSYSTGMPLAQPMRFKFVDTFYFIQYNSAADYTNSNAAGAIAPLVDATAPNNSIAAGDATPTMNHYSLVYFTTGKHPIATNPNGDFDLGYDCPFVGVNPPGSGADLTDLYHVSMGPVSFLTNIPAGKAVQPGSTYMSLPILNDVSTNDIGNGAGGGNDGILDNRRTQSLALFGTISGAAKTFAGTAPLVTIGGGAAAPGGAAFAAGKLVGAYNSLSIFNGGLTNAILTNPHRDPFFTGVPAGAIADIRGATVTTVTGKWDVKLDTKLTAFANNNTRAINANAVGVYVGSGRAGAAAAVANNTGANPGGGFTGDGSQFAAEAVVFEALLGGAKPKAFINATQYSLTGFNGNFPNGLSTILF